MARSDKFQQYTQDAEDRFDPLAESYRIAGQYTSDAPKITAGSYDWRAPQHPHAHQPPRGRLISFDGGGTGVSGGGGTPTEQKGLLAETDADRFQKRWTESADRTERINDSLRGRPWGHPQDYEDVLGPNRSGGLDTIAAKRPTPSPTWRGPEGGASLGAKPLPNGGNGNGLSGGAARKAPVSKTGRPYL